MDGGTHDGGKAMGRAARQDVTEAAREAAQRRFAAIRAASRSLAEPLSPEDQMVQSMADVSPTKWHLAHTSWFFETFLLIPHLPDYAVFDEAFGYLFNSYYESLGERHPRPERGLLSRPGVAEILTYRAHVDTAMARLIARLDSTAWQQAAPLIEIGLQHEQQHQELILMDIKHVFSVNPLCPVYRPPVPMECQEISPPRWREFPGGLYEIGHSRSDKGADDFAFDNEEPRHRVWLEPFRLASRLVTAGEFLAFIADNGYHRPEYWLSDGWATACAERWQAPLYWRHRDGEWWIFTLSGLRRLDPAEPVCHVSFYEAEAFARWAGMRLPSEAEWEVAAHDLPHSGNLADRGHYHPLPATPLDAMAQSGEGIELQQMIGDVWEWTRSPYTAYPGYKPSAGAIGEYNGKFMSNQMVLRGGAAITPADHIRPTYRNFFPPASRWAFSGIRLAADLGGRN